MGVLIQVAQFFLCLSLLIILHEGGHFLAARLFKTRVEKFYLFFDFLFPFPNLANFSLFKFKKGDTTYGLGWFPMGGYVKIAGMADESNDKEALKQPPQPWEYRAKPAWQRLIIILGGIIVNLFVGFFLFAMVFWVYGETRLNPAKMPYGMHFSDSSLLDEGLRQGDLIVALDGAPVQDYVSIGRELLLEDVEQMEVMRDGESMDFEVTELFRNKVLRASGNGPFLEPRLPAVIDTVLPETPAALAGIQKGDEILQLDSNRIESFQDFQAGIGQQANTEFALMLLRGSDTLAMQLTTNDEGMIGVAPPMGKRLEDFGFEIEEVNYSLGEAIPAGLSLAARTIGDQVRQFSLIFNPSTGAYKQVGGFARFTQLFPQTWSWQAFWKLTAIVSLILAFMNFLPIPMLDGGYMVFILYEMVAGKPPGEKFMERANTVGFIIILALLIFANLNDIIR